MNSHTKGVAHIAPDLVSAVATFGDRPKDQRGGELIKQLARDALAG